jgi:hypothetical protein
MANDLEPRERDLITGLEASLWRAETRFDRAHMERVLHEDFVEFGRSGRVYDRAAILGMPPERIDADIPLPDLRVASVGEGVALVTYTSRVSSDGTILVGNRSSLWLRTLEGWQLRFHQGTPASAPGERIEPADPARGDRRPGADPVD